MTAKKSRREVLFEAQNGICCLLAEGMCLLPDTPMTLDKRGSRHGQDDFATYEHMHPTSRGGVKDKDSDNVKLSHRKCNRNKSNLLIGEAPIRRRRGAANRYLPFTYAWLLARGYIDE